MSCLIKQRTLSSPGIIIFTHDELFHGVISKSDKVRKYLEETSKKKEWIYGIHIQGDLTKRKEWPFDNWQNFIMWPDIDAGFLSNVPKDRIMPLGCIHFTPDFIQPSELKKKYDICIVSRPSTIKRIHESMMMVKKIITLRPETTVIFIVPDPRDIKKGEKTYKKDNIDREYFDLPMKIFNSRELKNIDFLSPSVQAFGNFPISLNLVADIMSRTKFLLLTSHREGGPRVIVEAFAAGTPCIVSKNLKCGIRDLMDNNNTLFMDDNLDTDVEKVIDALDNYERYKVDQNAIEKFRASHNNAIFKKYLENIIVSMGCPVDGKWYLDELNFRLAGHGYKYNIQFLHDPNSFFHWINKVSEDPYNEDVSWQKEKIPIYYKSIVNRNISRIKGIIKKALFVIIRRNA